MPLKAVAAALDAAATVFTPGRRDLGPKVQAAIAASSELQERDALKHVGLATAMAEAPPAHPFFVSRIFAALRHMLRSILDKDVN